MSVTVSIVSHGHGEMVRRLVEQVLMCPEVRQLIVTFNIPEPSFEFQDVRLTQVKNSSPKGFGANHNAAFNLASSEFYCVMNPDIELTCNPFAPLLGSLFDRHVGLASPSVVGANGLPEDNMRSFLTPWSMVKRLLGLDFGPNPLQRDDSDLTPDWVAGMFMLFRSEAYAKVGGFDERYFMYCEDADICTRLWKIGYRVVGCLSVSVIHNAQRASHRSFKHLSWHVRSMARYFLTHSLLLPDKNG